VLSSRYLPDRQLPDKAIDLIDEAAAMIRTEIDSLPAELDQANREIMLLEIGREARPKERGQDGPGDGQHNKGDNDFDEGEAARTAANVIAQSRSPKGRSRQHRNRR